MTAAGAISAVCTAAALPWIFWFLQTWWSRHRYKYLLDQEPAMPPSGWPRLAVVVAARDEAARIEPAARSLLLQDYPALQVIAVDDRSGDSTGAILDRLASSEARLRVVHIDDLPAGWLGKTHALQRGAEEAADADWLLFTDADVHFAPDALRRAIACACQDGADHLVITPRNLTESFGERVFLAQFLAVFIVTSPPWAVEKMSRRNHLGIGAFNLVHAGAFRAIGGFRNLALSIEDDMRLGQALKYAGYQPRVLMGGEGLWLRWQEGVGGFVRGLEKNFFAAAEFRLAVAALVGSIVLWSGIAPVAGLFVGPWWARAVCGLGVAAAASLIQIVGRASGVRWWHGLFLPVSSVLLVFALARSAWLTLSRGGVRWRDRFYPLKELRAHTRHRAAWLRSLWRGTR